MFGALGIVLEKKMGCCLEFSWWLGRADCAHCVVVVTVCLTPWCAAHERRSSHTHLTVGLNHHRRVRLCYRPLSVDGYSANCVLMRISERQHDNTALDGI